MPSKSTIATRQHPTLGRRLDQLRRNLLLYSGGRPYIENRLWRSTYESKASWEGRTKEGTPSRKERAVLTNLAARLVEQLAEHIFAEKIRRPNADESFTQDVTLTGKSIGQFMFDVACLTLCSGWCWIGVDMPRLKGPRTKAERERSGDRVYWQLYDATEVVDWRFSGGSLNWLLLERSELLGEDPREEAKEVKVRYLYERSKMTRYVLDESKPEGFSESEEIPIGIIPFVPCGIISEKPIIFDDIEGIQALVLNKTSELEELHAQEAFQQRVFPASMKEGLLADEQGRAMLDLASNRAVFEPPEESGITRILQGGGAVLGEYPKEIERLENAMRSMFGVMVRKITREAESAEAKAWDSRDMSAACAVLAKDLQEWENKAVELSHRLDPSFGLYKADYPETFNLRDYSGDFDAIQKAENIIGQDAPWSAKREIMRCAFLAFARMTDMDDDRLSLVLKDFEGLAEPAPLSSGLLGVQFEDG